ncbi:MAG: arsinothricin resistance N-acetyltransferase ArsN1 family B [Planctomycetota bacterium]|jgi:phosphinothricin acetyltransferase
MPSIIRCATEADGDALAAIYAPIVRESTTSFEVQPPDGAAMGARVITTQERWPWLVREDDGHVTGYAYATGHRGREAYQWCVEVSVYVAESGRRKGTARALYGALFELLREQGYVNAYAGITLPNAPSVGVHEALGFRKVGVYPRIGFKCGAWHDVGWWELVLHEPEEPPRPPTPFAEIAEGPVCRRVLEAASRTLAR